MSILATFFGSEKRTPVSGDRPLLSAVERRRLQVCEWPTVVEVTGFPDGSTPVQDGNRYIQVQDSPGETSKPRVWKLPVILCVIGLAFLGGFALISRSNTLSNLPTRLKYVDTRVHSVSPPSSLHELSKTGKWRFGDAKEASRELEDLSEASASLQGGNAAAVLELFVNDNGRADPIHGDSGDDDNDAVMDHAYHRDDAVRVEGPIYFSNATLRNAEGQRILEVDDKMCHKAGKFEGYDPTQCVGAPYLYVTYHGGKGNSRVRNVCKYTRDGCSLGSVLMPSRLHDIHSLRGILLEENYLYVAEAWRKDSGLLKYSRCNPTLEHRRELLEILVETDDSRNDVGMIHPYGFARRPDDPYIYVSAQGTYLVLRYDHRNGEPGPIPSALQRKAGDDAEDKGAIDIKTDSDLKREDLGRRPLRKYRLNHAGAKLDGIPDGTFVDLGNDEVRGITFDSQGILYVANKQKGVMAFDKDGYLLGHLPFNVPNPISIYYCKERDSIWVGSAGHHALYEYDAATWELMQKVEDRKLKHPAGFVSYGDDLFVVSQKEGYLLKFSMVTGRLDQIILPSLPDVGERVELSPC